MSVNYGDVLKRSFFIVKDNPALWLFGIILALFSGFGGAPNFNLDSRVIRSKDFHLPKIDPETILPIIIAAAILLLVLTAIALFLSFLSRAALIEMAYKIDDGEKPGLKDGFRAGFSMALPLLLVGLLLWLPFFIGVLLSGFILIGPGVLLIFAQATVFGIILAILGGLIWLALLFAGSAVFLIISQYASRYYVLTESGIVDSIKQGYGLLRQNLGDSLLLWLINFGISFAQGVIVFLVALILGLPIALLALATTLWLLALLLIPFLIILFGSGLFEAYYATYWTLAFKKLNNG